ncbi:MAG: hypothetical protein K6F88_03405 [Ruminococcus sp.]|nr:hypothetical protein [Ruminococcus sp.]
MSKYSVRDEPICYNLGTRDCVFKQELKCRILTDTNFTHRKDRLCPFYKSSDDYRLTEKGVERKTK